MLFSVGKRTRQRPEDTGGGDDSRCRDEACGPER